MDKAIANEKANIEQATSMAKDPRFTKVCREGKPPGYYPKVFFMEGFIEAMIRKAPKPQAKSPPNIDPTLAVTYMMAIKTVANEIWNFGQSVHPPPTLPPCSVPLPPTKVS
jgi:hypothetical protein